MATYGGINNRPMAPTYNPAIATGFYANPANRGKKLSDLWGMMPAFNSWDDAARHDWSGAGQSNPAFANLSDDGRTNLLRSVYGLSSEYQVRNGQLVNSRPWLARNAWWLAPAAMVGGSALGALGGAGGGAGAGAAGGVLPSSQIPAVAGSVFQAGVGAVPAGGAGVASSFWKSPWLISEIIGGGKDLLGAGIQARSNNRASDTAMQANAESLAFLKEQDARDFAEYQKERERLWRLQDEDRSLERSRFDAREGRLTPYRDFGAQGVKNLAGLLTVPTGGVLYHPPNRSLAGLLRA